MKLSTIAIVESWTPDQEQILQLAYECAILISNDTTLEEGISDMVSGAAGAGWKGVKGAANLGRKGIKGAAGLGWKGLKGAAKLGHKGLKGLGNKFMKRKNNANRHNNQYTNNPNRALRATGGNPKKVQKIFNDLLTGLDQFQQRDQRQIIQNLSKELNQRTKKLGI